MINSKQKGKRGELELAHELGRYGFDARRGQQFCGANGDADVVGLVGIHIECKRQENLQLILALNQCQNDAKPHEVPAVFHKRNRGQWVVSMYLGDWMKMYNPFVEDFVKNEVATKRRWDVMAEAYKKGGC